MPLVPGSPPNVGIQVETHEVPSASASGPTCTVPVPRDTATVALAKRFCPARPAALTRTLGSPPVERISSR
jgi:hypothetical protein